MILLTPHDFSPSAKDEQEPPDQADAQRIRAAINRRMHDDDEDHRLPIDVQIAAARSRDEQWVALYNYMHHFGSDTYLFRLDMNIASGFGLCYFSDLRPDKTPPLRYTLRTVWLDRTTGYPLADLMPRGKVTRHFESVVELLKAVEALRRDST